MLPRKYRVHAFLILISLLIIFYPQYRKKPDDQRIETSTVAATRFLELVDRGDYEASWQTAAAYLKNDIPLEQWLTRLAAVREAAGKIVERRQKKYIYSKNPKKGVPEGEYMVYIFSSRFANKDDLTETVTLMLEEDGLWRVAGYFIE